MLSQPRGHLGQLGSRRVQLSDQIAAVRHRGPGFDRIRLIAAFMVVLHHCTTYVTANIAHDFLFALSGGLVTVGSLAVAIFFATSGALVVPGLLRNGDIVGFGVNRFLRIMPALVTTVLVTVFLVGPLLTQLGPAGYFADPGTYAYLANALFRTVKYLPGVTLDGSDIIVNGALWTLYFEILSYAALVIAFRAGLVGRRWTCLGLFFVTYAANALCWYVPAFAALLPDTIVVFLGLFVYFFAGVCLYRFAGHIPYGWLLALAATLLAIASMPLGLGVLVLPVLVPYAVVSLGYSRWLGARPLRADLSYGVYLNHAVVLTALLILVPAVDNYFVAVLIVGGGALLLAGLSWHFIEAPSLKLKTPAREALRRWRPVFLRSKPAQPAAAPVTTRPSSD
ncbi:MAG: acyltransferase [Hyphomicrobiales bacterium]|nr:MAG: acyltransferase [Hyphomicrobiales bacterium]